MCKETVSTATVHNDGKAAPDTATTTATSSYVKRGDFRYTVSLVISLVFALAVVLVASRPNQWLFDKEWAEVGFCVANADTPFWTSHDTSLYSDAVVTAALLAFYFLHSNQGQTKSTSDNDEFHMQGLYTGQTVKLAIAHLAHGIGHGSLAYFQRQAMSMAAGQDGMGNTSRTPGVEDMDMLQLARAVALLSMTFWVPMLKAACTRVSCPVLVFSAVLVAAGQVMTPPEFGFTYVQTILLVSNALNELTRPVKEKQSREYSLYPIMVNVPVAIMGWVESMGCGAFYKDIGGHVWYDTTIGLTMAAFMVNTYFHERSNRGRKQKVL